MCVRAGAQACVAAVLRGVPPSLEDSPEICGAHEVRQAQARGQRSSVHPSVCLSVRLRDARARPVSVRLFQQVCVKKAQEEELITVDAIGCFEEEAEPKQEVELGAVEEKAAV